MRRFNESKISCKPETRGFRFFYEGPGPEAACGPSAPVRRRASRGSSQTGKIPMKKLDVILAKVFKFITFVFFTFTALVYFGVLLLLPLDILFQIVRIVHGIGLPTVLAAGVGIAALGYIGHAVWKMPALYGLILDIGKQLVTFGHSQIQRFDALPEQPGGNT
jgi:hypothetical protein